MRALDTVFPTHWPFYVLIGAFGAVYSYQLSVGGQTPRFVPEPAYSTIVFVLVWVGLWVLGSVLSRSPRTDSRD